MRRVTRHPLRESGQAGEAGIGHPLGDDRLQMSPPLPVASPGTTHRGTALFVAVMSVRSAALTSAGASTTDATASGIGLAFLVGAAISLGAVVAAFFVRTPATAGDAAAL